MRQYVLKAWENIDPIYDRIRNFTSIETEDNISVFRVLLTRYRGPKHELADGNIISKGDYLVRIHLHNIRLLQYLHPIKSSLKRTFMLYEMVKNALPKLAKYIQDHELSNKIKGICGVTMLNKIVERLGFEIRPVTNPFYRLMKYFSQSPIHFLATGSIANIFEKRKVSYLFMSKNQLLALL
ncbi:hypothetical protein J2S74_003107 [Evansella vedderi]|uniref:YkoP-like domain-containing protein n=1 Tax=Evansella vedderi TaxID=38282 RepID=A0ABT9ZXP2_9BACI|nr:hypothetical protein [Evansella vedderi]MDQ0255725.1 hypothetical protein [Evansella vedderi]